MRHARLIATSVLGVSLQCHWVARIMQDSLAMRLPAEVGSFESCGGATHLCLELWGGGVFLGTYKLPLTKIKQALAGQVREVWNLSVNVCGPAWMQTCALF